MYTEPKHISLIKKLLLNLAIALVYFGAARLGLHLAYENTNATPVWPPSGVAFAALIIFGYRVWPGIFLGALAANILGFSANGIPLIQALSASLLIAAGNTLEGLCGTFLLKKNTFDENPLRNTKDLFTYMGIIPVMSAVSCTIGTGTLMFFGIAPVTQFSTIWFTWLMGDVAGIIVITSFIISWWKSGEKTELTKIAESILVYVFMFVLAKTIFDFTLPVSYLIIPFLVLAAFQFGYREVTTAVVICTGVAVWDTVHGKGPFAADTINESLILLLSFICIVSVTILAMFTALAEIKLSKLNLQKANDKLEEKISERTQKLVETNQTLLNEVIFRQAKETELKQKSEEFLDLYNNAPCGYYSVNKDGMLLQVNDKLLEWLGYTREQVEQKMHVSKIIDAKGFEYFKKNLKQLIAQGDFKAVEFEMIRRDGSRFCSLINATAIKDADGNLVSTRSTVFDISERKKTADALLESEDKFYRAFHLSPAGMGLTRLEDGKFIEVNDSLLQMFGYTREELIGHSGVEIGMINKNSRVELVKRMTQEGSIKNYETTYHKPSGEILHVLLSVEIIELKNVKCVLFIMYDITERKKAEEELKKETAFVQLLQEVADASNQASSVEEAAQTCLDKICELTQYPVGHLYLASASNSDRLLSTKIWHIEYPEKIKVFKEVTEKTDFDIGIGLPGRVLKSGSPVWILDVNKDNNFLRNKAAKNLGVKAGFAFPILIGNEVAGVLEFFSDETMQEDSKLLEVVTHIGTQLGRVVERKRAENALRASEEHVRSVVQNSYDAFILMDSNGYITDWNPQAEISFGWKIGEALGKKLSELIIPVKYRQRHENGLRHFHETGTGPVLNKRIELSALHRDGHEFPVELTVSPIKAGDHFVFAAFLHDISERKKKEELTRAKELAEQSNIAKNKFLANMSHEIRTPLNALVGFSEVLDKTKLNANQKEYIDAIKTSGKNLLSIINDILDYSKIEAGMMTLEQIPFSLKSLFRSTNVLLRNKAKEKKLELKFHTGRGIPPMLSGDPTRLSQILINLIGNAIKFTEKGEINVYAKIIGKTDHEACIEFKVTDTGIGIPSDKLTAVFERFNQASNDTTRKFGGTGLGLNIVKGLVELHDGSIGVSSEPGKGSVFTFTINFKKLVVREVVTYKQAKQLPSHTEKLGKMKVLVVEDNLMNQKLAKLVLSSFKFKTDIAGNGKLAVEKLQQKNYDLILMDIQMPEMDGYKAARVIRKKLKSNIPIIAMTAHAISGEKEKCLRAGMNDYISKPFRQDDLYNTISGIFQKNVPQKKSLTHNSTVSYRKKPAKTAEKSQPVKKVTDLKYIKEFSNVNKTFIREMIDLFLTQIPKDMSLLNEAVRKKDFVTIKIIAHKLKSSVSFMGLDKILRPVLDKMEEKGRIKKDIHGIIRLDNKVNEICAKALLEAKEERKNYL